MKRKLLAAVLVAVAAVLLLVGAALADTDPIVCSMEVSPNKLAAAGEVSVTINISNSGSTDMKDPLTLYNPISEVVSDFGENGSVTLKAGETITWTGKWDVNDRTLQNGAVVYFVKYTLYKDTGESYDQSQPIRGAISAQTAATDIDIKRTITPGAAREGQTVTVRYDIVNTGTVSLTNITIKENKDINKDTVTVAKELKAGETAQVKFPVTMGKKNLTSSATITYTTAESSKKQTKTVEDATIVYGEPSMTAKLTSDKRGVEINGTVTLTLALKNAGNIDYSDIRITDAKLGDVWPIQELAAGASLSLDKEITLTETTDYQFTITAIDNTGTEVSLSTDALTLTAVDPSQVLALSVTATADRTEVYTQPGIVRFSVEVANTSTVDASKVSVYHGSTLIYTFDSIPAGQSRSLTRDVSITMAGKYRFTASTVDALGNSMAFNSNDIQIALSVPTPAPATATPVPDPTAEPTYAMLTVPPISDSSVGTIPKFIRMFFYPLMIVSIIVLAGALVLLVMATKKRAEVKKASAAALDHLERAQRRDYIAPNEEETPAPASEEKAAEAPAKAEDEAVSAEEPSDGEPELPHMKYVRNAYQRTPAPRESYSKSAFDDDPLAVADDYGDELYTDEPYAAYDGTRDLPEVPVAADTEAAPTDFAPASEWDDAYADSDAAADESAAYSDAATDDALYADPNADYADESRYADPNAGYADDGQYADPNAGYADDGQYADPNAGYADEGQYADPNAGYADDGQYADPSMDYADDEPYEDDGEQPSGEERTEAQSAEAGSETQRHRRMKNHYPTTY